jgi:hypothetical protein
MLESLTSTASKKDCHCQEAPPNLMASLPETIPPPEEMGLELDKAIETEFLASSKSGNSSDSGDHFAAIVKILQQYPGLKITLST